MEEGDASNRNDAAAAAVIQTLTARGWSLRDTSQLKALIQLRTVLSDDASTRSVSDSVESELLNMDLRSIGARSLPDPNLLRKADTHIQGPKVLQVVSVRDLSQSTIEGLCDSSNRRMLRLGLTDGCSEITAIEYSRLQCTLNDVVPGTKVRLENKVPVHSGILCLNPKVVTILGGLVQSLYDEWQVNQKYLGFSRSVSRPSQESDSGSGPPPFQKLQIEAASRRAPQQATLSVYAISISKSSVPNFAETSGNIKSRPIDTQQRVDEVNNNSEAASVAESTEQKPSNFDTRPKEVAESVPVQNQAAAQKLLQKMSHSNQGNQQYRSRKHRGKGKERDTEVFTLDEWDKRRAGAIPSTKAEFPDTSRDENLAWHLQNQLDMDDSDIQRGMNNTVADDIRMSMFSYDRDTDRTGRGGRHGGRGRGKGKGRGGGRGKGRGRGRFD